MAKATKQNYLYGAAIMTATTVIVKVVAFFYKLPLGDMRVLGDEGFAHFTVAYNIYGFILTLATSGFPVALSRMISVAEEQHRPGQVQRIFRVALSVMGGIGAFFSLVMLLFNQRLSVLMSDTEAALSIAALSPAVLVVCLASAYRGYCQGRGNMIPTAFGQVIEEVGKLAVGLSLAWWLSSTGRGLAMASAGAIFGVTAGAIGALSYMMLYKRRNYSEPIPAGETADSRAAIVREFLSIGVPIAVGSSVLSLVNLLDNALCLYRLQGAAGFTPEWAHTLYGVYGKAQTLYNLPSYFITPLTLTIVPAIATCLARRDRSEAGEIAESSLRIAALVTLPMGVGLFVLSEPIFRVIFWGSNTAGPTLLRLLGVAAFFVCMNMMCAAILQAAGKERLPIVSIVVGGTVKICVNWVLVGNPAINITGAPIGSICCFGVICAMDYLFVCASLPRKPRLSRILGAPALSCAVMGVTAFGVYTAAARLLSGGGELDRLPMALAMAAGIGCAVIVYAVMIVVTGAVTREDMALIPAGEKLGRLLHLKSAKK